jgi:hypothetical protein
MKLPRLSGVSPNGLISKKQKSNKNANKLN